MDFFSLLAECAITLAGFSAIYAVLQGSTGPRGAFRSIGTLGAAALAFFTSIFPLIVNLLEISEAVLWSISSALAGLCTALIFTVTVRMSGRLTTSGFPPQGGRSLALAFLLIVISTTLFASNIFYWPDVIRRFIYALGVLLLMIVPVSAMATSFVISLDESLKNGRPEGSGN